MGYYVNIKGMLSFVSIDEKHKFITALANDSEFKDFLSEGLGTTFDVSPDELEYEFITDDIRYIEQDYLLSDFLQDNSVDAKFRMSFIGEDGNGWRVNYDKQTGCVRENKVFLSDEIKKPAFSRGLYSAKRMDTGETIEGNLIYREGSPFAYILTPANYDRMVVDEANNGETRCDLIRVMENTVKLVVEK